mmetsp:Transcript_45930/g.130220  ORF Transcript_45930/g.130220 Transcript_45930/m.130220 type:complete len:300 (+) Transcript_45930:23-922(+)
MASVLSATHTLCGPLAGRRLGTPPGSLIIGLRVPSREFSGHRAPSREQHASHGHHKLSDASARGQYDHQLFHTDAKKEATVRRAALGASTSSGSGSGSSGSRRPTRISSVPLIFNVPAVVVSPLGPIDWPYEQERAKMLAAAAERNILTQENQTLKLELARMRRQARIELNIQRAEILAQQAEREELQQLADEAQRLINLKDLVESGACDETGAPADLSEEERQWAAEQLMEDHQMVLMRAEFAFGSGVPPARAMPGSDWEPEPLPPGIEEMLLARFEQMFAPVPIQASLRRPRHMHAP